MRPFRALLRPSRHRPSSGYLRSRHHLAASLQCLSRHLDPRCAALSTPDEDPLFDEVWWGYRPKWAGQSGPQPINARAERLDKSKYFRGAFHKHRCLITADGWYEWVRHEVACMIVRRSHSRPDLPSHRQYPTRYGGLVTSRLKALGQCSLRLPAGARFVRGRHACEHQRGSELARIVHQKCKNRLKIGYNSSSYTRTNRHSLHDKMYHADRFVSTL